jgi:hypothetical protein
MQYLCDGFRKPFVFCAQLNIVLPDLIRVLMKSPKSENSSMSGRTLTINIGSCISVFEYTAGDFIQISRVAVTKSTKTNNRDTVTPAATLIGTPHRESSTSLFVSRLLSGARPLSVMSSAPCRLRSRRGQLRPRNS